MKPLKIKSKKAKKRNKKLWWSERKQYVYYYTGRRGKIYCSALPKDISARHSTKIGWPQFYSNIEFLPLSKHIPTHL
jgi:hypothetical protein